MDKSLILHLEFSHAEIPLCCFADLIACIFTFVHSSSKPRFWVIWTMNIDHATSKSCIFLTVYIVEVSFIILKTKLRNQGSVIYDYLLQPGKFP